MARLPLPALSLLFLSFAFVCWEESQADGDNAKNTNDIGFWGRKMKASIQQLSEKLDDCLKSPGNKGGAVAFTVRFAKDDRNNGIPVGNKSPLKFDHIVTNLGNGYDPTTGIFTAPRAGVYVFFYSQMSVNGKGGLFLVLDKNGKGLAQVYTDGRNYYDQGSTQVTTHLEAKEEVWVRHHSGSAVRGGTWTVFTGYLIQED